MEGNLCGFFFFNIYGVKSNFRWIWTCKNAHHIRSWPRQDEKKSSCALEEWNLHNSLFFNESSSIRTNFVSPNLSFKNRFAQFQTSNLIKLNLMKLLNSYYTTEFSCSTNVFTIIALRHELIIIKSKIQKVVNDLHKKI